jgi:hypothetical protein
MCNELKGLWLFWKNSSSPDGRRAECAECSKRKERSPHRREARRKSHAKYRKTEKYKQTRAKIKERLINNPREPKKVGAWSMVRACVLYGLLPKINSQTCVYCNSAAEHYHHYLGYSFENALDVVPVCRPCNSQRKYDNLHPPTLPSYNLKSVITP